ncbi:DUF397 domain-containing protein [Streptomyces sp. NPDC055239]
MPDPWQKSSYCQEGDACVHVAALPAGTAIHLTESADPTKATLTAQPTAFAALIRTTKRTRRA